MPASKVTKATLEAQVAEMTTRMAAVELQLVDAQAQRAAAEELAATRANELQAAQEQAAAAAQQAAAAAAANQAAAATRNAPLVDLIPKPRGSGGVSYNIRRAMRLGNDKVMYSSILRLVRDLVHTAKLNWRKTYAQQDPLVLGRLFRAAQEEQPYLARFDASWATADLVKQYMRNRRKYSVRKGYIPRPQTNNGRAAGVGRAGAQGAAAGQGGESDDDMDIRVDGQ